MATRTAAARGLAATGAMRSPWAVAADLVDPPGLSWKREPVRWAVEKGGLELWSAQRRIIESVRDNRLTAVASCHEVGKSFIGAATAAWWIDVHPPGDAFVVTTAPSDKQVKAILWREINRLHSRLGLQGRTNLDEWYIGKELVAYGRKPSDYDPTAFQGIHALYVLVIIDEGCGVPKSIYDAASSLTANRHGRTLVIGNPDDANTEFGAVCRDPAVNYIKIGYRDTPNFTGEQVSERLSDLLISREWVAEREAKWGRESALFMSKCDGEFPTVGGDGVVPLAWAERCRWLDLPLGEPAQGGIDVAAGGDRTVLYERRGMRAGRMKSFVDPDPMRTVGLLVEKINEWGLTRVKVDPIGVGWALMGRLQELSSKHNPTSSETTHDAEVVGVNFAESPTPGKEHLYLNKRAEVWWEVGRENSRLGLWDLSDVGDDTIGELTTPRYEIMDSKGKVKIESKKDVKKRLEGMSPDEADALLLAFYDPVQEASWAGANAMEQNLMSGMTPGGWSAFG